MASPPFDATKSVTFDLARGQIRRDDSDRRFLLPARGVVALCEAAGGDATAAFGRSVGQAVGDAVVARFESNGEATRRATIESVLEHLAGELALLGLGFVSAERWGRALVLVIDHATPGSDDLLAPLLSAAISRVASAEAVCVRLSYGAEKLRFLVTSEAAARKVRDWLGSGVSWGEALVRLHPSSQEEARS